MTHDVFISYSSKDKPAADATCAALEAKGFRCWIAPRDVLPGAEWAASIVKAISQARIFVLLLSANANTSPQISREVERAVNRGIPVIPMRLEDVAPAASLEYFINTPHWLDAFSPPLEEHLNYLTDVVRTLMDGGKEVERPEPSPPRPARSRPRWLWPAAGAGAAVVLIAAAVTAFLLLRPAPAPAVDAQCVVFVAGSTSPSICQSLVDQNPTWQSCAASFDQEDMAAKAKLAQSMIAQGRTGLDLYQASAPFKPYGAISHYWEMFGQCVNDGFLKFDDISNAVAFPDEYWGRTRPLRQVIGRNWKGANQPLPDFMSNFQSLCQRYRAARDKAAAGGGATLDCGL